jgi:sugar lactone lactonase YvrE
VARAGLAALLALAAGCATRWTPRTDEAAAPLAWPYPPAPAKLIFERSLTGFAAARGAGGALRDLLIGRAARDAGAFVLPVAAVSGPDGRLAVADLGRACVHLWIPAERRYLRLTGGHDAPLVSPVAVAFDDDARLWVSDSTGRLLRFDASGELSLTLRAAGDEPLQRPTGLAWNPHGQLLYVVDTLAHRIHALRADGQPAFSFGGRGAEPGRFNFPTHAFWSSAGELWITDSLNFRIQVLDEHGAPLAVFGHHGDGSGDLALPKGVAVDRDGTIYVADGLFDNVQLFDRRGEFLMTLGRRGSEPGDFWLPAGVFVSQGGELYVCDTYNRRVQVFRITQHYAHPES